MLTSAQAAPGRDRPRQCSSGGSRGCGSGGGTGSGTSAPGTKGGEGTAAPAASASPGTKGAPHAWPLCTAAAGTCTAATGVCSRDALGQWRHTRTGTARRSCARHAGVAGAQCSARKHALLPPSGGRIHAQHDECKTATRGGVIHLASACTCNLVCTEAQLKHPPRWQARHHEYI